jgi:aminopeptidase N
MHGLHSGHAQLKSLDGINFYEIFLDFSFYPEKQIPPNRTWTQLSKFHLTQYSWPSLTTFHIISPEVSAASLNNKKTTTYVTNVNVMKHSTCTCTTYMPTVRSAHPVSNYGATDCNECVCKGFIIEHFFCSHRKPAMM